MTNSFEPTSVTLQDRFIAWFKREFDSEILPQSISSGLLLFFVEAIFVTSFSALIFKGRVGEYLPIALTYILIGDAIVVLVVSLLSSYPGSIAVEQDTPAVIISLAVAGLVSSLPAGLSSDEIFSTVLIMILSFTMLTGLVFLGLGFFKLGALVRYLPYPVMGGFLAGTGWLLAIGGIDVMQSVSYGVALFSPEKLIMWLPGLIGGVVILLAIRKWSNPITLIVTLLGFIVLFYLVIWVFQLPFETISADGWLLGPFPEGGTWSFPLSPTRISQANWPAVYGALPDALPAIAIGAIALLLNATGLELIVKDDLDINRELIGAGTANVLAAFGGGLIGYHAISLSVLNHTFTRGKRLPGIIVAILLITLLLIGTQFLAYVPRLALGALLVFLGLELLYEWVIQVWSKFPRVDAVIVMTILLTIVFKDFLWGIGVGMILTIVMFVVSYSRVNIIRYIISGESYRSRHNRDLEHSKLLEFHGDKIQIIKLDGFIFFGTANHLYEKVQTLVKSKPPGSIEYILMDFEMVTGMDSTGLLSFQKMLQYTLGKNIILVLTGLSGRTGNQFEKGGFTEDTPGLKIMRSLDRSVEWCETQVITKNSTTYSRQKTLAAQLSSIVPDEEAVNNLLNYMSRREYEPGDCLIRKGDPPEEMLIIESGQVTVQLETESDSPLRLETTGGGRVVGELGFYLDILRTADVVADTHTVAYILSKADMNRLIDDSPKALNVLSRFVIQQTSQRIVTMTRELDVMRK